MAFFFKGFRSTLKQSVCFSTPQRFREPNRTFVSKTLRLGFEERCISDRQTSLSGLLSTIISGRERADRKSAYGRPGDLTTLNTDNVNFCTRSDPYQPRRMAIRPGKVNRCEIIFAIKKFQVPSPRFAGEMNGDYEEIQHSHAIA